ncbi:nicotinamide-nucleotide adenylyltransferase [Candidatus Nitrosopelagicus sp.]|nr:nicotinamide-nucleotide adenylyltransferase [Candidatus Nitrosopelagicus sp.]
MIGFLIGRFQPFHLGHLEAIKFALAKVEHLHVGIGSSNKSHEERNPFTADERKKMILSSINDELQKNLSIHYIPDVNDHSKWTDLVDEIIPEYDVVFSNDDFTHELYGKRGKSIISVELKSRSDLSGTNIRNLILTDQKWKQFLPSGTVDVLSEIDPKKRLSDL